MATPCLEKIVSPHPNNQDVADTESTNKDTTRHKKKKQQREFDFSMWNHRHYAFKLAYLGWNYHGFAIQDTTNETIEAKLFDCLLKTRLIEDHRQCNYSRCGRTDKGVSALGQVIALHVRSNLLSGPGVIVNEGSKAHERKGDKTEEIKYMQILNKVLPDDIRILACAPVHVDFSARFNCLQRIYKYFFPLGNMNLDMMREAAQKFVGDHDYRNFCKMDISGGVTNFKRRISSFIINPLDNGPSSPYQMYEMTISGQAFLWHQVRCMAGILFLIGNNLEKPELIEHMLDVEKCPRKPQYGMASDLPLILYDCMFEDINWQVDQISYRHVISHFQQLWTKHMIQTTMVRRMLDSLQLPLMLSGESESIPQDQVRSLVQSDHKLGGVYKPILSRPTSDTFEERYEHHKAKKRKIDSDEDIK